MAPRVITMTSRLFVTFLFIASCLSGCSGNSDEEKTESEAATPPAKKSPQSSDEENFKQLSIRDQIRVLNLKQLGLALVIYHGVHHTFPMAEFMKDVREYHWKLSWRVRILPVLDEQSLYESVKANDPWDSNSNKRLIDKMPKLYSADPNPENKTTLHVFIGNGAPFSTGPKKDELYGLKLSQFKDGPGQTILVIEAGPETAQIWTMPGGIAFDPKQPRKGLGTLPATGFFVLMADASVWRIPTSISDEKLKALITFNGGEKVDIQSIEGAMRVSKPDSNLPIEPRGAIKTAKKR